MNRPRVFTGTYTAIVTPFRDDAVAYDELEKFVNFQVKGGMIVKHDPSAREPASRQK